ncbi:hypothetical protein M514_11671 [Trichuris suis]|uniref:Uncharacterized protein n=1 Tax=Trichuris suis TaxID=68888 RepID=A0A085MTS6_9BILA|nr:hypothetical protein M513_11671 [Trichuris suis]KFD60622.1 hypothetical protein M514_11671 [Trichuris suis]
MDAILPLSMFIAASFCSLTKKTAVTEAIKLCVAHMVSVLAYHTSYNCFLSCDFSVSGQLMADSPMETQDEDLPVLK